MTFIDFALIFFPVFFIALVGCALLTPVVIDRLRERAILDCPNERSMHTLPTPRGGGLAILGILIPGFILGVAGSGLPVQSLYLLLALLLLAGVCWLDDKRGLGVGIRFFIQFLAAILGMFALPDARIFPDFISPHLEHAFIVIGWVWAMNLTNFMDGIDGITGIETLFIVATVGFALALLGHAQPLDILLLGLLGGAMAGFLPFNWPPARVFLGDVGSVPIGFLMAYFLLLLAPERPTIAFILPLYYLADSTLTLLRRMLRGDKFWLPHREHFYQRAAARFGHRVTVLWIMMGNAGLGLAAFLFYEHATIALVAALIVVALLLFALHKLGPQ